MRKQEKSFVYNGLRATFLLQTCYLRMKLDGMELHCIELDPGGGKLGTSNIMNGIDPKTCGERHNHILGYVGAAMWERNADYVSRCR